MPGAGYATEDYLRGPDSPWLLVVVGVVWAAVLVLVLVWGATAWGATAWRSHRSSGLAPGRARDGGRRPRHAATGRAAGSAVSVREIAQRLDREAAARARRPQRRVAVIHRKAPPPGAAPVSRTPEDRPRP